MDHGLNGTRSRKQRAGKAADFAAMMARAQTQLTTAETANPVKARARRRKLAKGLVR